MARRPTWFDRVPDILAELDKPTAAPFFDREAIECLFGLKRRQSIALMKKELKRYAIGKAYVVDRAAILRLLRKRRKPGREEAERQQRVIDTLAEFRQQVPDPAASGFDRFAGLTKPCWRPPLPVCQRVSSSPPAA